MKSESQQENVKAPATDLIEKNLHGPKCLLFYTFVSLSMWMLLTLTNSYFKMHHLSWLFDAFLCLSLVRYMNTSKIVHSVNCSHDMCRSTHMFLSINLIGQGKWSPTWSWGLPKVLTLLNIPFYAKCTVCTFEL